MFGLSIWMIINPLQAQVQLVMLTPTSGIAESRSGTRMVRSVLAQPMVGVSGGNGILLQSGLSLYARINNFISDVHPNDVAAPMQFSLHQNFPNPFNPATTITFTLHESGLTTLKVYDIVGREVTTLVNEYKEAGIHHQIRFVAVSLASGIYIARLTSGSNVQMKKMLLLK